MRWLEDIATAAHAVITSGEPDCRAAATPQPTGCAACWRCQSSVRAQGKPHASNRSTGELRAVLDELSGAGGRNAERLAYLVIGC